MGTFFDIVAYLKATTVGNAMVSFYAKCDKLEAAFETFFDDF